MRTTSTRCRSGKRDFIRLYNPDEKTFDYPVEQPFVLAKGKRLAQRLRQPGRTLRQPRPELAERRRAAKRHPSRAHDVAGAFRLPEASSLWRSPRQPDSPFRQRVAPHPISIPLAIRLLPIRRFPDSSAVIVPIGSRRIDHVAPLHSLVIADAKNSISLERNLSDPSGNQFTAPPEPRGKSSGARWAIDSRSPG